MKKLLALLLVVVSLFGPMTIGIEAKTTDYKTFVYAATSKPYSAGNYTEITGQMMLEKAITVKKGKKKTIKAELGPGAKKDLSGKMTTHVRFAVWVYDVVEKERVAVGNIKVGQSYQLPVNKNSNKTYSVQLRPYISTSAWRYFSLDVINAYVKKATFRMVY